MVLWLGISHCATPFCDRKPILPRSTPWGSYWCISPFGAHLTIIQHILVAVSSSSQQEVFEGGFLQQAPHHAHHGRQSHIQLEGFEPGESDDGFLNRYI